MHNSVVIKGLRLGFGVGAARVEALRGVDATFPPGQITLVTGPSGSGKTSLLSVVGALVRPEKGKIVVSGKDLTRLDCDGLAAFRREQIGFVFQAFRLVASMSAAENVALSLHLRSGGSQSALMRRAEEALKAVGLGTKTRLLPRALSGGEKQRVAIARALAHSPPLVLADEPTASLDAENGVRIMELLRNVARIPGRTVVIVSHDDRARPFADRIIQMEDGVVVKAGYGG